MHGAVLGYRQRRALLTSGCCWQARHTSSDKLTNRGTAGSLPLSCCKGQSGAVGEYDGWDRSRGLAFLALTNTSSVRRAGRMIGAGTIEFWGSDKLTRSSRAQWEATAVSGRFPDRAQLTSARLLRPQQNAGAVGQAV